MVNPGGENPLYEVSYADGIKPIVCFSKIYSHESNPSENFAAIMTCSEADVTCPYIPGASLRIPLTCEDPKVSDDTPEETSRYVAAICSLFGACKNGKEVQNVTGSNNMTSIKHGFVSLGFIL